MKISILKSGMTYTEEDGYVGFVHFEVEGHVRKYEMALQSKKGRDWGYSLFFLDGSGPEEQINQVEEQLEEDDELYDRLIDAARQSLESKAVE
ncbi:hypothetical protein [Paenibacillus xylaniclasticus]|uniref:hypothetical protein n=1 Tax=Paenibacillus xylaniclasticus TaxID=588083 RepID=UPI000FDC1392|nr:MULTISPECIES: hypothetical protein [Paenibacillus]GFN31770.1 hypothetical protein PCURB6_20300 [Paenibacillus curdlanolyticus]